MIKYYKTKNKKALSTVVATLLIILLTMAAATIVWGVVSKMIKDKTEGAQSCFNAQSSGKVTIEDSYTCYNLTSNEVQFSINIGDVDVDSLLISILVGGSSRSYILTNISAPVSNLRPFRGNYGDPVQLPTKNGGETYVAGGFPPGPNKVDSIKIAPVVEGKQCDASDETYEIDYCSQYEG